MQVGDLIKCHGRAGLLVQNLRASPEYWIVLWSNGVEDTLNVRFGVEVISAGG